jgi:hypothetical protein
MPIPKPHENEDNKKFISRCMSDEVMNKEYPDTKQRVAICLGQTKHKSKSEILEELELCHFFSTAEYDQEWEEWIQPIDTDTIMDENERVIDTASEGKTKKVKLNKPFRTPGGPKKFSVYVKNDKGNVVKVNFGDPDMEIKRDDPERRKSYRARHHCDDPGPKWKANYWSCKMWSKTNVSDMT